MNLQPIVNNDKSGQLGLQAVIAVCSLPSGTIRDRLLVELTETLRCLNRQINMVVATPFAESEYNFKVRDAKESAGGRMRP